MWWSLLACTRSRMTRDRCHSWRIQACSADHRRPRRCSCLSVSGVALAESERMIIPTPSSVVIELCDPHAHRCQRPAFGRLRHTRARYCRYSEVVVLLRSLSSAAVTAHVHLSLPILALVSIGNKKGRPQWGRPRSIGLMQARYQGVRLSARGSVSACANARATAAGVPVRMTSALLRAAM